MPADQDQTENSSFAKPRVRVELLPYVIRYLIPERSGQETCVNTRGRGAGADHGLAWAPARLQPYVLEHEVPRPLVARIILTKVPPCHACVLKNEIYTPEII
jgi:hypothetical protein